MSSIQHANNKPRRQRTTDKNSRLVKVLAILGSAVIALFIAGYFFLNLGFYSPGGYVQSYLETVADKNSQGAKDFAGVGLDDRTGALITDNSLAGLKNISITDTTEVDNTVKAVTASYTLVDTEGNEEFGSSVFYVKPADKILGIFDDWSFAEPPVTTISVTVENDWRFRLNQENVSLPDGAAGETQTVTVLVPGVYQLKHESNYFTSSDIFVSVQKSDNQYSAQIELEPTEVFTDLIRTELDGYLDECATQQVLQPSGCPFGKYLSDQAVNKPVWSITNYPDVSFEAHDDGWLVPPTEGTAHLSLTMKSLFDGREYEYSDDVPFRVSYLVVPDENGNFRIVEQLVD